MSENENEKNDTVIAKDKASETATVQSETPSKKRSKLPIFIALFLFILIFAIIFLGGYFYKENNRLMSQQQKDIAELSKQLTSQNKILEENSQKALTLQSRVKTQVEQVNAELLQAKNRGKLYQTDIQAMQRALAETKVRHPNDWILAEVEYMVRLAGRKIWLERDIPSAIALLLAADQRVAELGDVSLSVLRKALLEDINTLEALPNRDPDGVVLALSALERRIDELKIIGFTRSDPVVKEGNKLSDNFEDWEENLGKTWSSFVNDFIIVNERDTKIQALLSPEQRWYLKENVRHDLAKAGFAVYREQQDVYDLALHSASNLLNTYYDLEDTATKHFSESLARLAQHKISINYPDQLKSAPVLERIIKLRVKKSLASSRVEQ